MTPRHITEVPGLPNVPGAAYSHAVVSGDECFVSGQLPLDPVTGAPLADGPGPQTRVALARIFAILGEAGFAPTDIVATTVLLDRPESWSEMNAAYADLFAGLPLPARTAFAVGLPRGVHVEIQAVARRR